MNADGDLKILINYDTQWEETRSAKVELAVIRKNLALGIYWCQHGQSGCQSSQPMAAPSLPN
jgi:hypothetical protein